MKRIFITVLLLILTFTFTFSVSALETEYNGDGFTISFPADYIILDKSNLKDNEEFITSIDGNTPASFEKHMDETSMLLYAAPEDNSEQVQFFKWSDDASELIGSLSALDDDNFNTAAQSVSQLIESENCKIISSEKIVVNDVSFIKFITTVTEPYQTFGSIQYITIAEGSFYSLAYYNQSGEITNEQNKRAESIFATLDIEIARPVSWHYYLLRIIGIVIIIASIAAAVMIVMSIVKDFRSRRNTEEKIPDKIKMNRDHKNK